MTKYRWYIASLDTTLQKLADRMRKRAFVDAQNDDTDGFRVQERKATMLVGQYIEKQFRIEHIALPTGEEFDEPRSHVWVTQFSISTGTSPNLLLTDPPRRASQFFNALSEASSYDCSFEPAEVNLWSWIAAIERVVGPAKLSYAECSGVQVSPEITGRFSFRGTADVRQELKRALDGRGSATIDIAKLEIVWEGRRSQLELTRHGGAKVDERAQGLLSLLSQTISEITN